ncbi:MAG: fatty acyl-AMP ligase [Cyanobacteria bacterium SID2]|nr:fatty acyl-AMP ligase [Cyanobacteria bacterium SID2]MBP0004265.1 fatty acyl-AMP ligase [Cyanobacteria bacterium SBC]
MTIQPRTQTPKTSTHTTLVERLQDLADRHREQLAYQFLIDGKTEGQKLSYGDLDTHARAIAAWFQQHGARDERALLLYPQGLNVIAAFCGCLYAGVVAVPVPPPEAGRLKRTLPRLQAIIQDARASIVLTTGSILNLLEDVRGDFPELDRATWLNTETIDLALAERWHNPGLEPDGLAYLQYTSGSTSTPKGVMLSHRNLMGHLADLQQACGYDSNSVTVNWMPYFHDYGLVEGLMEPLYNGTPCYVMSPFAFVKRPLRWLQAIDRYRGTHSQAPNFAYDLCVRRAKPKDLRNLDLSTWEAAGNAAEPINPEVLAKFYQTFSQCGFRWNAFAPAYGLAEATLLVSAKPKLSAPVLIEVDAAALEQNKIAILLHTANANENGSADSVRAYPSCGRLVCDTEVAIVNPDTFQRCASNEVGEIWVSSSRVAQGYWRRPDATKETFQAYIHDAERSANLEGPFLRTGDLGFLHEGELFITGRMKDLIIIRGTNHYPQDIEWTIQQLHPALRPDYGAAFSIFVEGNERLVVVQEVERRAQIADSERVICDVRQAISEVHELQVYAIVLAKPGTILKTSSGKIQRRACRSSFLAGSIEVVADWCEDPQMTDRFRCLSSDVESVTQQVREMRQTETSKKLA